MSDQEPHNHDRVPSASGIITALVFAILMNGAFVLATADAVMPPTERWAALTTFALLSLAYTLQGSPEVYDALGRIVRRDTRALVPLVLLLPVLYTSYSLAVDEFQWDGLLIGLAFAVLPALAFVQSRGQRTPTLLDLVATLYLLVSLEFNLLPGLQLPQQSGLVSFFFLSAAPLLLLLLAARGWPGLGFTWFMNWRDLRDALLAAGVLLLLLLPLALFTGLVQQAPTMPSVFDMLLLAVNTYFLIALPQEILFRGVIQNGITRFAEAKLWRGPGSFAAEGPARLLHPATIGLVSASIISGLTYLYHPVSPPEHVALAVLVSLCYGWVYQRTGKVTASAVAHMLVVWCWLILFV